jgi:hypothetical protein
MRGLTVVLAMMLCGCSIKHEVVKDYPQYLINSRGESQLPTTKAASAYALTSTTAAHHYEFRSAMAGYANVWVVEFGKVLDATLQSEDVQKAFGKLTKAEGAQGSGVLVFDLQTYTFTDLGAHVSLKVSMKRDGEPPFVKVYTADGATQGGKMFWGGAFAMKNAVQQSTKLAVDQILRQLISDLNAAESASEK